MYKRCELLSHPVVMIHLTKDQIHQRHAPKTNTIQNFHQQHRLLEGTSKHTVGPQTHTHYGDHTVETTLWRTNHRTISAHLTTQQHVVHLDGQLTHTNKQFSKTIEFNNTLKTQ